jgi:hypothetical protein
VNEVFILVYGINFITILQDEGKIFINLKNIYNTKDSIHYKVNKSLNLMYLDPCIIVQLIKKNPARCNNISKLYYSIFI